jgi:hypothetical protein
LRGAEVKSLLLLLGALFAAGGVLFLFLYVPYLFTGRRPGIGGSAIGALLLGLSVVLIRTGTKNEDNKPREWDNSEW